MDHDNGVEFRRLSVLAVDDHEINRDFLHAVLSPKVASLALAGSGFEAVGICRRQQFDLILMDLHMPDLDGLSAWREIVRQAGNGPRTRVIALTADSRPEERERVRNAGFHGFVNKPVAPERLTRVMDRVARGRDGFAEPAEPSRRRAVLLDCQRAARASGNAKRAAQMRAALLADIEERFPELDRALAGGRFADAAEILHQWAGASGYAGATLLEESARALEHSLGNDLDSSPGTLYLNLVRTLDSTRQSIAVAADEHEH